MARQRQRQQRNQKSSTVQNVRVMDPLAGNDGMKLDRQLSAIHDSSNHVQMLCSNVTDVGIAATDTMGNISWTQIAQFDDWISLAQQFLTFRVRSIRFEIFDINPGAPGVGLFSTFHDQFTSANIPAFTFANVVDGPDSTFIPPGTGKVSLSWVGHTTVEKGYYDVNSADANREDFGGLRYFVQATTAAPLKYRIITKAIVDFRGRR